MGLHKTLKTSNSDNPQEQLNVIIEDIRSNLMADQQQRLIKENVGLLSKEF